MTIRSWSTTAASNNAAPPNGWPEGQAPSSVNNVGRQMMADIRATFEALPWFDLGHTATRVDADTFTVPTDLTATYIAGAQLKLVGATTEYGIITSSSYSAPDTTVNISGTVPTSLSTVSIGITAQPDYRRTAAEIAAGVTPTDYSYEESNVKRYGALGDKTTDDLAAFNRAASVAAYTRVIYIPSLQAGYYYKLSDVWTLSSGSAWTVYGDGISSLIVIANGSGSNAMTLSACVHCTLRDFGIYGTNGCGNLIELTSASNNNTFERIWGGWGSAAGLKITSGQSNDFNACSFDQNSGFRPATLAGGLTDGSLQRGVYIVGHASGLNNNNTFSNCKVNASGSVCGLQVGDTGVLAVESFNWTGGLLQGSSSFAEFYLVTKNSSIIGTHVEPPINNTIGWIGTLDACSNTVISKCEVAGDIRLINSCSQSGIENMVGAGVDISANSSLCFVRDSQYGNITTGPGAGLIKDRSGKSYLENLTNSSSARYASGKSVRNESVYFQTSMQDWIGTTLPCGFDKLGTPTLTRDGTIFRSGLYSAKIVSGSANQGIAISVGPINEVAGKKVTVEAWIYNVTTAGLMSIRGNESSGGAIYSHPTFLNDTWERTIVTFDVQSSATNFTIEFQNSSAAGTFYVGPVKITLEEHSPVMADTLDTTATPAVSNITSSLYGGYPVPLWTTADTTAVTNFLKAHTGKPFTIKFSHNKTITHNANIVLNAAANFAGVSGNTLTLCLHPDGVIYEVARKV